MRGRALLVGVVAGLAIVAVTGGTLFALGYIPVYALNTAFGVYDNPTMHDRLTAAFIGPVPADWVVHGTEFESGEEYTAFVHVLKPLPTLVLVLVTTGVGLGARRLVPASLAQRGTAFTAAALTAAATVAVLAASLGYDSEAEDIVAFPAWRFGLAGFLAVGIVGAFAFGFVASWPARLRVPAQYAGATLGLIVAAGMLLFSLGVPFGPRTGDDRGRQEWRDVADTADWASGTAAAVIPLALGAEAEFRSVPFITPLGIYTGEYRYWPGFGRYIERHPQARLTGYADAGGLPWKIGLAFGAALVLALWVLATVLAVRRLGAPRASDGLRTGALVGGFGAGLLLAFVWLGSATFPAFLGGLNATWGVAWPAALQAAVELVVLTALAGLVYAALRPTPARD